MAPGRESTRFPEFFVAFLEIQALSCVVHKGCGLHEELGEFPLPLIQPVWLILLDEAEFLYTKPSFRVSYNPPTVIISIYSHLSERPI